MPDDHRPAMPQVTAVDDQFGTHRWVPLTGNVTPVASQGYPGGGYYPCLRDQIDAWHNLYAEYLDGIYVDEAPTDCLNEQTSNYGAHISQNYAD